jgi:hypothetical protein
MQCTRHGKVHDFGAEKPIFRTARFQFFKINFIVWSHILSTGGDALRVPPNTVTKISEFSTSEAT